MRIANVRFTGRYDAKGSFAVHIMIVVGIGNDILF